VREKKLGRENFSRGIVTGCWKKAGSISRKKHLTCYEEQNSLRVFPCHWWLGIKYFDEIVGLNSAALCSGLYAINHPWKVLLTGMLTRLNKTLLCTPRCVFALVEEFTNDPVDSCYF